MAASQEPEGALGTEPVVDRLDRITALLELAFQAEIDQARTEIHADKADAAILDLTAGAWIGTTELQKKVAAKTGNTARAVRNHISTLTDRGLLLRRGPKNKPEYRSAGIV